VILRISDSLGFRGFGRLIRRSWILQVFSGLDKSFKGYGCSGVAQDSDARRFRGFGRLIRRSWIFASFVIQRCNTQSPPLNLFGFCNISFDKWRKREDKAPRPPERGVRPHSPALCGDADRLIAGCCATPVKRTAYCFRFKYENDLNTPPSGGWGVLRQ
jgi:hypothetical protein